MAHLLKEAIRGAAMVGDLGEVERLVKDGAPVHDTDFASGNTAVHLAAANGHSDTVEALLKAKPDSVEKALKTRNKKGKLPVDMAKAAGIKSALQSWSPPPPPAPAQPDDCDQGAHLRAATDRGDLGEVLRLIHEGADVNAPSAAGYTPLHCACDRAVVDCVEELLKRGANPSAVTNSGATPLHYAAGSRKADSVRLLLEDDWTGGRATLEAPDKDGKTALRWALEAGNTPAAQLLVAAGADPFRGSPPLPSLAVPKDVADVLSARLSGLRSALAGGGDGGEANLPREALALVRARRTLKNTAAAGSDSGLGGEAAAAAAVAAAEAVVRAAVALAEQCVAKVGEALAAATLAQEVGEKLHVAT